MWSPVYILSASRFLGIQQPPIYKYLQLSQDSLSTQRACSAPSQGGLKLFGSNEVS